MTGGGAPSGAVHWDAARTVRVTATLGAGVVLDLSWPIPLDAVLAAALRRDRLGDRYGAVVDHHHQALPLCRWRQDAGSRWWWMASCCAPVGTSVSEVQWWHRRFDVAASEIVVDELPPIVRQGQGRYRDYRQPIVVTAALAVEWWAIGDPDRIEAAARLVSQLGKKRSTGYGLVIDWTVTDEGDPDWEAVVWRGGVISRPVPIRCARAIGAPEGVAVSAAPYRPPYWRPPPDPTHLGGFARAWPEVIAPGVTRP